MATVTVYGEGGFDPELPNGNIIEQYEVEDDIGAGQSDTQALAEALAAQVKAAIDAAEAEAVVQEQQAADDARANALNQLIVSLRSTLAEVASSENPPE